MICGRGNLCCMFKILRSFSLNLRGIATKSVSAWCRFSVSSSRKADEQNHITYCANHKLVTVRFPFLCRLHRNRARILPPWSRVPKPVWIRFLGSWRMLQHLYPIVSCIIKPVPRVLMSGSFPSPGDAMEIEDDDNSVGADIYVTPAPLAAPHPSLPPAMPNQFMPAAAHLLQVAPRTCLRNFWMDKQVFLGVLLKIGRWFVRSFVGSALFSPGRRGYAELVLYPLTHSFVHQLPPSLTTPSVLPSPLLPSLPLPPSAPPSRTRASSLPPSPSSRTCASSFLPSFLPSPLLPSLPLPPSLPHALSLSPSFPLARDVASLLSVSLTHLRLPYSNSSSSNNNNQTSGWVSSSLVA